MASSSSGIGIVFDLKGVDVQDYVWANEEVGQFREYVEDGNRAFRETRFLEAVSHYSRAIELKPTDHVILGNRSAAYIRVSQSMKHKSENIEPNMSFRTFAQLALDDAESLQKDAQRYYILKFNALILLEENEMARDIIVSGLRLHPSSEVLRASRQSLEERMLSVFMQSRIREVPELINDFDCTLCLSLLYEPITTPCGHSFCRSCLFESMDNSNKCPLCRTILLFTSSSTFAVSVTVKNIIQKCFPEKYAKRKSVHDTMINFSDDLIPLFVMEVVIPCQKFSLRIIEPGHRLMVRRIMEGNRRMGMVIHDDTANTVADFACEVMITECKDLPGGCFALEIESRRRFRIVRCWEQDGYRMAKVEWVQDVPPTDARAREELQKWAKSLAPHALSWLRKAKEAAAGDQTRLERLRNIERMMPPDPQDPELFSFWIATMALFDFAPNSERLEILRLRDTRERISRGTIYNKNDELGLMDHDDIYD